MDWLKDPGLRAAVQEHLRGLQHGADPPRLTEIIVDEATVLDGIARFHGLRVIGLEGADVTDLHPLETLADLHVLVVSRAASERLGALLHRDDLAFHFVEA